MTDPAKRRLAGFRVVERELVASTNDEAAALAEAGEGGGLVVWARKQGAGRGRRGRNWDSPPGNLYCSALLTPDVPVERVAELSLVAGVALAEAVVDLVGEGAEVALKWPNDVLLAGGKVAGILLEGGPIRSGRLAWVVLGTGVNVATRPVTSRYGSTALTDIGVARLDVEAVLAAYLERLAQWQATWHRQGFEPVRRAWHSWGWGLGQWIEVADGTSSRHGKFAGLGPGGALRLADRDGQESAIAVGDVVRVTPTA